MFHDYGYMAGMHALWWLFWLVLLIAVLVWLRDKRTEPGDARRDRALETLRQRLASGEINIEEFKSIKQALEFTP